MVEMLDPSEVDVVDQDPVEEEPGGQTESIEEVARKGGWVPQDEWTGNPDDWKPARQFVEDGFEMAKSIRKHNETLERKLSETTSRIEQLQAQISQLAQQQSVATKNTVDSQRQQLEAEIERALDDGDREALDKAYKALHELDQIETSVSEPTTPARNEQEDRRVVAEWAERNKDWYGKDEWLSHTAAESVEKYLMQGFSMKSALVKTEAELAPKIRELRGDKTMPADHETGPAVTTGEQTNVSPGRVPRLRESQLSRSEYAAFEAFKNRGVVKDPQKFLDNVIKRHQTEMMGR